MWLCSHLSLLKKRSVWFALLNQHFPSALVAFSQPHLNDTNKRTVQKHLHLLNHKLFLFLATQLFLQFVSLLKEKATNKCVTWRWASEISLLKKGLPLWQKTWKEMCKCINWNMIWEHNVKTTTHTRNSHVECFLCDENTDVLLQQGRYSAALFSEDNSFLTFWFKLQLQMLSWVF